ncbi:hypothetical protein PVV74_11710 [Roseovarius sp. SK2]|uniref:hypothetical protein n=1 Tax=Roseovarius TaxID=74030 RepID=UPI00237B7281|nr:hypothetical protein [Roseovarius sp. SK2]MDD9726123.1 hypothetical protein [Roseovarius sp. SK2]
MSEEIVPLTKSSRRGKSRVRFERLDGAVVDGKLQFKSKQAVLNYELSIEECYPSDIALMDAAFVRCQKDTREYRRQRKAAEMVHRGKAHCYKAGWLRTRANFDQDECLFFPSFVIRRPTQVRYNFKSMAAARCMLLMTQGLPGDPEQSMATHTCGNGHMSCVNPKHLAWGNAHTNARDRVSHNEQRKFMSGMDQSVLDRIREDKRLCKIIALETGVPASVIDGIKTGDLWAA